MKKKVFLSILVMICFLFGINSVKAKTGENEIGEKTTFYKYCYGDACRFAVFDKTKERRKLYDEKGIELDGITHQFINSSDSIFGNLEGEKYLHRIKATITGLAVNDETFNFYLISDNKSIDTYVDILKKHFSDNGYEMGDDWWKGLIIESTTVYTLVYSYGSDEIDYDDDSRIGLKVKELADATENIIDKEHLPDINYGGGTEGCAILTEPIKKKINWVLDFIKYAGTALAIILGAADFLKATLADDDNASKKAFQKFINRLIAAVLLFLIPLILQFLFTAINNPLIKIPGFNADSPTCGIGVSENE